jgi:hypothetical protein
METNEELKKEIASLKRRLTSALKQRDEKNLKIYFDIADRRTTLETQ